MRRVRIGCRAAPAGAAAQVSVDGVEAADGWIALLDDGGIREAVGVRREARPVRT